MQSQPRYIKAPWFRIDQSDLQPKGDAETLVETHGMRIVGLLITADDIPLPDGASHKILSIRAVETDEPGGLITMAITNSLPLHIAPVPVQSNPRRHAEDEDGA